VHLSVCHGQTSNCFFFFVSLWNPAIFWQSILHDPLYKRFFFDFWFRPPNAQNLLPKTCTPKMQIASYLFLNGIEPFLVISSPWPLYKILFLDFWFRPPSAQHLLFKICPKSPISQIVRQIDRRCLHLPGGFREWPIQWNHAKCCAADPRCHGNEIWARRGDLVAYRLVYLLTYLSVCVDSIIRSWCVTCTRSTRYWSSTSIFIALTGSRMSVLMPRSSTSAWQTSSTSVPSHTLVLHSWILCILTMY